MSSSSSKRDDVYASELFDTNRFVRAAVNGDYVLVESLLREAESHSEAVVNRTANLTHAFLDTTGDGGTRRHDGDRDKTGDDMSMRRERRFWIGKLLNHSTEFGALHLACAMGHVKVCEILLTYGYAIVRVFTAVYVSL